MFMPAARQRRYTAAEVRLLVDEQPLHTPRLELVDGQLLVTPSPVPFHQRAVAELLAALHAYLLVQPAGIVLSSPSDVELESESTVQPDVFVVPAEGWAAYRNERVIRRLLLVAEILSPSSGRYDRVTKRPLYQRNVPEYWLVDTDARLVERWRRGEERSERVTDSLEWLPVGATRSFVLDLPAYFNRVVGDA